MNPNDSSVASELRPESNTSPVFRNGIFEMPNTPAARANLSFLLRASKDVGYTTIGNAMGHDKSFVCRLLNGEAKANIFEWLAFCDSTNGRITEPNAESAADADLLNALLRKTASVLAREASTAGEGDVFLHADEYKSLLVFAQRGIKAMQEAAL